MSCPTKWTVPAGQSLVCEGRLNGLRLDCGGLVNFESATWIQTGLKCPSCGGPVLLLRSDVLRCMTAFACPSPGEGRTS